MFISGWRQWMKRLATSTRRGRRPQRKFQPRIEMMEKREVPTITPTNQAISFIEGISNPVVVASFQDTTPSLASQYTADINWGDGSPHTAGTVSFDNGTSVFTVTASHAYAEETPLLMPNAVTVQIQETANDMDSATANSTALPETRSATAVSDDIPRRFFSPSSNIGHPTPSVISPRPCRGCGSWP